MSDVIISPNMNLPVPVVGQEPGPQWAIDVNNCFNSVDSHDHSSGQGVQITPSGLNISSDLTFLNHNAISLRTARFVAGPTIGASDLDALYVNGVDLYYVDGNGNQVRITNGGSVAGSQGSISGLASPASASYNSSSKTFVWQSDVNTPANMDNASIILRNLSSASNGLTLNPPPAMGADFSLTLPNLPTPGTGSLTIDTSGNIGSLQFSSSVGITSGTIAVQSQGITQDNILLRTNGTTVGVGGFARSASSGSYSFVGTALTAVSNLSVTITSLGNPIFIGLIDDGLVSSHSRIGCTDPSMTAESIIVIKRNGGVLVTAEIQQSTGSGGEAIFIPSSSFSHYDVTLGGTYTYQIFIQGLSSGSVTTYVQNTRLVAYEIK